MIYGNIFRDILGCLDLLLDQKLLTSSIPWSRTSKDENEIEALMLTHDKNWRYIAILANKIMIASQGNSSWYPEKIVKVLSLGRFNSVIRETAISLGKFPFATISKSLLFELFSVATSVSQCFMNMWNILKSNLTTLIDNLIKLKQ